MTMYGSFYAKDILIGKSLNQPLHLTFMVCHPSRESSQLYNFTIFVATKSMHGSHALKQYTIKTQYSSEQKGEE